ncbi:glycosyltransferase family 9 protein [candidate division WOR-3 bacterium]|nr:glycosyltransferase family 9 protein [candidate division WOR-3 bacterium]
MKILIINLAAIGDVVLSSVIARELKKKFPGAEIHYLAQPICAPAMEMSPFVDKVLTHDKKGGMKKYLKMIAMLRKNHYDMSVSANFAMRGALIAFFVHAKQRLGYDYKKNGIFFTHRAEGSRIKIQKEALNQLEILKSIGIFSKNPLPLLKVRKEDEDKIKSIIGEKGIKKRLIFCPVCSVRLKSLPVNKSMEIIKALSSDTEIFAAGGKEERHYLEELSKRTGVRIFPGTLTLGELAALFYISDGVLSIDSGPFHIAQAVGVPVTGLFGPTDHRVWGAHGENTEIIEAKIDCSPCSLNRQCDSNLCMNSFDPENIRWIIMKSFERKRT